MLVGEAPGAEEEKTGKPFVGRAGQMLNAILSDCGLRREDFYVSNAVRCRPLYNRPPKMDEIRECRKYLIAEIKKIKPTKIIALGANALKALLDQGTGVSVEKYRGHVLQYGGIPLHVTYHPSYCLRNRGAIKDVTEDFRNIFGSNGGILPFRMYIHEDLPTNAPLYAIDVETTGLDPWEGGTLLCGAIATSPEDVYWYKPDDLYKQLDRIPDKALVIGHNVLFDFHWIDRYWRRLERFTWGDSMIAFHFYDENAMDNGLKSLGPIYCRMEPWAMPSVLSLSNETAEYNSKDAIACFRLWQRFAKPDRMIFRWVNDGLRLAFKMRRAGIFLSRYRVERFNKELAHEVVERETKLLQSGVNLHSTDSIRQHVFGTLGLTPMMFEEKTGKPSLCREALDAHSHVPWVGEYQAYKKKKDELTKYGKTIVRMLRSVKVGSIIHPAISVMKRRDDEKGSGGTDTGRITCNLFQTLPREGPVKSFVVSRYGSAGCIVVLDLSQIEYRVGADVSRDSAMMAVFARGQDFHTRTAQLVFQTDTPTDDQRQIGKKYNFAELYGATPGKLAAVGGLSFGEAERHHIRWTHTYGVLVQWQQDTIVRARRDKFVVGPTGRVYHLPNIGAWSDMGHSERKAINSPIQGGAADVARCGMDHLQHVLETIGTVRQPVRIHLILQVYDSIVLDCHKEDLASIGGLSSIKTTFLVGCGLVKRLGWDMRVPIEAKITSGPSYGDQDNG